MFTLVASMTIAHVPEQVHVALGGPGTSSMRIQWTTAEITASVVQFGTAKGQLDHNATGSARSYLKGHGFHHAVLLPGPIDAGVTYYYRVGDGASMWSAVKAFAAPLAMAGPAAGVALSVFGDMGYENSTARPMKVAVAGLEKVWSASYTHSRLRAQVEAGDVDGIWHLGDLGYMDDSYSHEVAKFMYEDVYDGYMNWLEPIASRVPYMVTPGVWWDIAPCRSSLPLRRHAPSAAALSCHNRRQPRERVSQPRMPCAP